MRELAVIHLEKSNEELTNAEAFLAMEQFLLAFWERDGSPEDGPFIRLLSFISTSNGRMSSGPADPAMWGDWIDAIKGIRAK